MCCKHTSVSQLYIQTKTLKLSILCRIIVSEDFPNKKHNTILCTKQQHEEKSLISSLNHFPEQSLAACFQTLDQLTIRPILHRPSDTIQVLCI